MIREAETLVAKSELTVVTKAKDLCGYVLTATEKSPKRFRFTLVNGHLIYGHTYRLREKLCRETVFVRKSGEESSC